MRFLFAVENIFERNYAHFLIDNNMNMKMNNCFYVCIVFFCFFLVSFHLIVHVYVLPISACGGICAESDFYHSNELPSHASFMQSPQPQTLTAVTITSTSTVQSAIESGERDLIVGEQQLDDTAYSGNHSGPVTTTNEAAKTAVR